MGKEALTRKYRPQKLDELFNQEHIKKILKNAIKKNRIYHAYLFAGPRGVGKTSTARILAKSLNCVNGPTVEPCGKCKHCVEIANSNSIDVVEIDGASNRGIDEIRSIKEHAIYLPVSARYKVFIIDEVHMLTDQAFNALLKILEEPPPHVVFIFATTAPHKVPKTILSRCQRYDFRLIPKNEIIKRLKWLCENENIEIDEASLELISLKAAGSFRDAESILEQVYSYSGNKIVYKDVRELLGVIPADVFIKFFNYLHKGDTHSLIELLGNVYEEGYDMVEFYNSLVDFTRDILMRMEGVDRRYLSFPSEFVDEISFFQVKTILKILSKILEKEQSIKLSQNPKYILEILVFQLCEILEKDEKLKIVIPEKTEVKPESIEAIVRKIGEKHFIIKSILDQSEIVLSQDSIEIKIPEDLYKTFKEIPEKKEFEINLKNKFKNFKIIFSPFKQKETDPVDILKKHFTIEENHAENSRKNSK